MPHLAKIVYEFWKVFKISLIQKYALEIDEIKRLIDLFINSKTCHEFVKRDLNIVGIF